MISKFVLLLLLSAPATTFAFVAQRSTSNNANHGLSMANFDKKLQKFVPDGPQDEESAGYDKIGSLLRHGPQPFFQRLFKADEYEQAVLKFMAMEKCDRNTAQGNMDAYLRNPNDWAVERFETEKKGLPPRDYVTLSPKKLTLTLAWVAALGLYASYLIPVIQNTPSMQIQNANLPTIF